MKTLILFLLFAALHGMAAEIVTYELDPEREYPISLALNQPCTITFPSDLDRIFGANVVTEQNAEKVPAPFIISYQPGNSYMSLRAQSEGQGVLHIIYNRKTYILQLVTVKDEAKGCGSITFRQYSRQRRVGASVSPMILKGMLDKCKMYDVLLEKYPAETRQIEFCATERASRYKGYDATIVRTWRFDKYDTLVFLLKLTNHTDEPLFYTPTHIAFTTGENKLFASMVEATGVIPPMSQTIAFVSVTGSPDGWRNNLRADNKWSVLIQAGRAK